MTSNISGVSASRAPRATEPVPLLRVVTGDGGTSIPAAALERSAEAALADYESGLRARLDAATAAAGIYASNTRPRLRLAPPPGPEQPATPCPPWCIIGDEHEHGEHMHSGDVRRPADWLAASLHIDDDDTLSLRIGADSAQDVTLSLAEVDELIEGLTQVRAEFADALAAYRQPTAAGGAA
ncbi:MAG TPA: hypothetical protein VFB06_05360 [Streptosporangiaceae bacterium]|nr:hypothetical protein [Streptosporangiaceae bacterium]